MVYRGPSTGCRRCRQRHVKCDETTPVCRRCTDNGKPCPGFQDANGIVFKDVTQSVIQRQTRKQTVALDIFRMTDAQTKLQPQIIPSRSSLSINYFFLNYVLTTERDPSTSLGHFDYLVPLYQGCTPLSVLDLAVSLMSTCALCLHLGEAPDAQWYLETEQAACQALQSAITDPQEGLTDQTLLAVLCLNFVDQLYSRIHRKALARTHVAGAIALAQHWGPARFDNEVSQSLLAATRAYTVRQSLWCSDDQSQDAIFSLPAVASARANPAVALQYILAEVLVLERRCIKERQVACLEERPANLKPLNDLACQLSHDADQWFTTASETWQIYPYFGKGSDLSIPSLQTQNHAFTSVRIAYVVGQWCCVQLMLLKYMVITSDDRYLWCIVSSDVDRVFEVLFVVLTYLQETGYRYEQSLSVFQGSRMRSGVVVRPGLGSGYSHSPADGRHYLFTLLYWIDDVLAEDQYGTKTLRVTDRTLQRLSDLSSQAQILSAENVGYHLDP